MLGWTAFDQKDYRLALEYAFHTARLSEKYNNYRVVYSYSTIAECYERLNKLDSALIYAEKAESMSQDYNWNLIVLSGIHARLNHDNLSLQYYRKANLNNTFSKDSSDIFTGIGMKAKDKDFNATIQTDFDTSIGKINIVPQDMGRVLLNLYNNAFYAVNEKSASLRTSGQASSAGQQYEPTISVSTKKINDTIEIRVKDNGNGIPQKVLDKIFQPFFTTKPTGEGTGLGLSLSYDIIKAHGGELKVETEESEGAAFIISLALNENL
jgi:signal transduction histidine kinase